MFWWFNVFSPQTHWPLSGAVSQDILPDLLARAGDARTETRVLREVASYGRQIGAVSDVLLALADASGDARLRARGEKALAQLRRWTGQIDAMKPADVARPEVPDDPDAAAELLQALLQRHPQLGRARPRPVARRAP